MSEFTAKFLGVRGGYPVPGPSTLEFGGNTTCLEVWAGPHLIVIDAGTGIIGLGEKLVAQRAKDHQPIIGTMLFTHGHHDHTQGLSFFEPLRFNDSIFHVFGPYVFEEDLADMLKRAMLPPVFPIAQRELPGMRSVHNVHGNQMIVVTHRGSQPVVINPGREEPDIPPGAIQIWVYHSSNHPKGGTLCYRIEYGGKRLVFATDTEGYVSGDTLLSQFARGADLLVHDAEYTEEQYIRKPFSRQGWGHSTWNMAVEVAQRAGAKRLALTHHNAEHDDDFLRSVEKEVQAVFPNAFVVREGTTATL